ncbi:acyl carrier protein [bacterium]|nr:acyl carrier protein [bacterium]
MHLNNDEFLSRLAEVLQVSPSELVDSFKLDENNFDSLALISTIALIDECFNTTVNIEKLMACRSIKELLALIADALKS